MESYQVVDILKQKTGAQLTGQMRDVILGSILEPIRRIRERDLPESLNAEADRLLGNSDIIWFLLDDAFDAHRDQFLCTP